jgi:hypothetical protein
VDINPITAVLLLALLLIPVVGLLSREIYRFFLGWFRGYSVREVGDRPLGLSQRGRSKMPTKVCPGCGQVIPLAAGECRYCLLRFDPAPLHRPVRPRRLHRPAIDFGDSDAYEPPERRRGAAPL